MQTPVLPSPCCASRPPSPSVGTTNIPSVCPRPARRTKSTTGSQPCLQPPTLRQQQQPTYFWWGSLPRPAMPNLCTRTCVCACVRASVCRLTNPPSRMVLQCNPSKSIQLTRVSLATPGKQKRKSDPHAWAGARHRLGNWNIFGATSVWESKPHWQHHVHALAPSSRSPADRRLLLVATHLPAGEDMFPHVRLTLIVPPWEKN